MKYDEFNSVVQECLSDTWGVRHYPIGQVERLWTIMRDLNASEFRYAIESLNLSSVRAPTLGQVRTALLPALNRIAEDKKREKMLALNKTEPCIYCAHTGYVTAYKAEAPLAEYSFICRQCRASAILGFQENHGMRAWDNAFTKDGWRLRLFDQASDTIFIQAQKAMMGPTNGRIVNVSN